MNRDITVPLSLFILIFIFILDFVYEGIFVIGDNDTIVSKLFGLVCILVAIRFTILWFQTLIHAVKYKEHGSRLKWLVSHLILGIFASYLYYFVNKSNDLKNHNPEH